MKNENDLNAWLSRQFKRRTPALHYLKTSDKYGIGIPDFLLWRGGVGGAMESKFIRDWPKKTASSLLRHPFSGPQITRLAEFRGAGAPSFGLVGVGSEKSLYLIESQHIPKGGNWPTFMFKEAGFPCYPMKDVDGLLGAIFAQETQ